MYVEWSEVLWMDEGGMLLSQNTITSHVSLHLTQLVALSLASLTEHSY